MIEVKVDAKIHDMEQVDKVIKTLINLISQAKYPVNMNVDDPDGAFKMRIELKGKGLKQSDDGIHK